MHPGHHCDHNNNNNNNSSMKVVVVTVVMISTAMAGITLHNVRRAPLGFRRRYISNGGEENSDNYNNINSNSNYDEGEEEDAPYYPPPPRRAPLASMPMRLLLGLTKWRRLLPELPELPSLNLVKRTGGFRRYHYPPHYPPAPTPTAGGCIFLTN